MIDLKMDAALTLSYIFAFSICAPVTHMRDENDVHTLTPRRYECRDLRDIIFRVVETAEP